MRKRTAIERREEKGAYVSLRRAVRAAGYSVHIIGTENYCSTKSKVIVLRRKMSIRRALYTLAHEYGHALDNGKTLELVFRATKGAATLADYTATLASEIGAWHRGEDYIPVRLVTDYRSHANHCVNSYRRK